TGRAIVEVSECSFAGPRSSRTAFSLRSRTTARRTVQTLIGSYVALRTSTRPPIADVGDDAGPCRWCSSGDTDPTVSGGTVLAIFSAAVYRPRSAPAREPGPR